MQILSRTNYDFIKWRWHAIVLSTLLVVAGVVMIFQRGLPLGIDFSGGTIVVFQFENPVGEDEVRNAIQSVPGDKVVQQFGSAEDRSILIRVPQAAGVEEGFSLEKDARALNEAVKNSNLGPFTEINREVVGPAIGKDLQRKGLWATLFSVLGITAYIALRFRLTFAIGAIAATFHDILITLAFLVFFGYDLTLNVIAALLTITGYSVNDTIVIFDRVRENLHVMRRDDLEKVVNHSVNQTLTRTVITAGTTFMSVLALYLYGGEVLEGFAFTMLVGIVSGTYSTIFIAAAVAIIMSKRSEGTPSGAAASAAADAGTARPSSGGRRPGSRTTRKADAR
ncbi:MAG TPA: protein translocase subunit SecF [Thermoanaerobaculia bacterium]|nr:protein translocase subunit SecF [Thermoanaerobaculia bacterium]